MDLPDNFSIITACGLENAPGADAVRLEVFCDEQGFSREYEFDEHDPSAYHAVIFDRDDPVATGRLVDKGEGRFLLGRFAVKKDYRMHHLGSALVRILEAEAIKRGGHILEISAQTRASEFYETLGYTSYGEPYMDEHVLHIHMEKAV